MNKLIVIASLGLLLAAGCKSGPPPKPTPSSAQGVFEESCTLCHEGAEPAAKLDLSNASAVAGKNSSQVAGMEVIKAGDPKNSYLLHKLRGTQATVGGRGKRMPIVDRKSGSIPDEWIAVVEQWIADGAK